VKITVHRIKDNGARTLGVISVDGMIYGWTLEEPWRNNQRSISCIPAGEYPVRLTLSNRFKMVTPELLNVPDRTAIRIHPGNTEADTEGCILVGWKATSVGVYESRPAYEHLFAHLQYATPGTISILMVNSHKGE
jgi:hypothetical protein